VTSFALVPSVVHVLAASLLPLLCMSLLPQAPLFRCLARKTGILTAKAMTADDMRRMLKRRMADIRLPGYLSPHSFRVGVITDLLSQGVPLEEVQNLAGHADPRTTRLYDRRQKKVMRSVVDRISV
jgi:integrase/recombinase XerD